MLPARHRDAVRPAGTVTDDTEQALLLARLVIEGRGTPDPAELASQLLTWEESMRARGSLDLLGPSTRRALSAVAAGIDGATVGDAVQFAAAAAASAAQLGHWAAGADVATRIMWAAGLVTGLVPEAAMDVVYRLVGSSLASQESVPAAFAVAAASMGDPWLACRMAASLGGDSDTIAAMAGAIC